MFGTDYIRNLKSQITGRIDRNCLDMPGLDNKKVKSVFLQPLIEINKQNFDNLISRLPSGIHPYNYIRKELHFCPECIKMGFHGIFHQFKLLQKCPYHQILLQRGCPSCKTSIPFEISDSYTQSPFKCRCGEHLLDQTLEKSLVPNWRSVPLEQLISTDLKIWLNLNQEQVKKIKNIYVPLSLNLEKCPEYLNCILSVVKPDSFTMNNHRVVKSAPYIRHLSGKEEKEDAKLKTFIREYNFYDEIYNSSLKTVNSIISQVR